MFRKLVSNLPFSPSLVGQLGFYAKRLRREELTRRLGLIFTALALVVQSFAVISPPEPANAASSADFIRGGIRSLNEFLTAYDSGNGDLKDIFSYAGITRAEIAAAKAGTVNSKDKKLLSWGRTKHFSAAKGEISHTVPRKSGGSTQVYSRPLHLWDSTSYTKANGSTYQAYIGFSKKVGWFAILKNCANLVTKKTPKPSLGGSISATCEVIKGFAYDGHRLDLKAKVLLYAGGPPGKGALVARVIANDPTPSAPKPAGNGHGYTVAIPAKYRTASKPTSFYGALVPLSGGTTRDLGTATMPTNCNPKKPIATCTSIGIIKIDRTKFKLTAQTSIANGATISSYTFVVKDSTKKIVTQQQVKGTSITAETTTIELQPGEYTASVIAQTSIGAVGGIQCQANLTVNPPEKCPLQPSLTSQDPSCQPCPGDASLWVKDPRCSAKVIQGKLVSNLTKDVKNVENTSASGGDRLEYTIYAENVGLTTTTTSLTEELKDALEYGSLQDAGGGIFEETTKKIHWDNITLKPGERQTRKFVVELFETVPATPQGVSDPASYDCKITNTFGNTTEIRMQCPVAKTVERTVTELPKTGPGENMLFAAITLAVVTYFYARSRLLNKEVKLIRRDFTTGAI